MSLTKLTLEAMDRRSLQRAGEDAAAALLTNLGMRIVARNWRIAQGEIDIVAWDGDLLVFVEVKARASYSCVHPVFSVGFRKQSKIKRLAEAYLTFECAGQPACRFDVVCFIPGGEIEHLEGAF